MLTNPASSMSLPAFILHRTPIHRALMAGLRLVVALGLGMMGATAQSQTTAQIPSPPTHQSTAHQSAIPPAYGLPQSLLQKMAAVGLQSHEISVYVAPLSAQRSSQGTLTPIIHHLPTTPKVPASTQKLIASIVALDTMGANYRWYTRIYHTGVVIAGTLHGDVYIKGSGDPSMTHARLNAMLGQLYAHGIRHVAGDIIVDNRAFGDVAVNPAEFDGYGLRAYNAQPNAFLVNFGALEIDILPSGYVTTHTHTGVATSEPIEIFTPTDNLLAIGIHPRLADFSYPTMVMGAAGACHGAPRLDLNSSSLQVSGTLRPSCGRVTYWLNFKDADAFITKAVKGAWRRYDPHYVGQVRLATPIDQLPKRLPVVSYPSRPLSDQLYDINQYSNNVMTEQLALTLPLWAGESVASYDKVDDFIRSWWQQRLRSPAPVIKGVQGVRASGLCRECHISPQAMGELLAYAYGQPNFETLIHALPVAGRTGTMQAMARRRPDSPAIGRAYIKTGTLDHVVSMAGYVVDSHGRWYVVVGMINSPDAAHRGTVVVLDELLAVVASQ